MKIGILTFQFAVNYGALVQAWALKTFLERKGHHVEIVNYLPYVKQCSRLRRIVWNGPHEIAQILFERKFSSFAKKHLTSGKPILRGQCRDDLPYDLLIVGSDQVWNVRYFKDAQGHFDAAYWLDFAKCEKMSYAASIGEGEWDLFKDEIASLLSSFKAISVREEFAKAVVSRYTSKEVSVVPDPTLLLTADDYAALTGSPKVQNPNRQIFVYALGMPQQCVNAASAYRRQHPECSVSVSVLRHGLNLRLNSHVHKVWPTPCGWLRQIRSSELVVTNSFHGMMMSLIFGTPVMVCLKENEPQSNNRLTTVLDVIGAHPGEIVHPSQRIQDALAAYRDVGRRFITQAGI